MREVKCMSRTNKRGSVVSFVVVGVLLAAAVLGGLYVLKERNFFGLDEQAEELAQTTDEPAPESTEAPNDATDDAAKPDTAEPTEPDATDEPAPSDETPAGGDEPVSSDDTPATDEPATDDAKDPAPTEPATPVEPETPAAAPVEESDNATADDHVLPETGPADGLVAVVGLSSLVGSVLIYRRSFRP